MFSHPAFLPALVGSDTESKALLTEKNVTAVCGVNGNDGVVFGEVADVSLFGIYVTFSVETSYPVVGVAENVEDSLTDTSHNSHVEYNVDGVGNFDTDLSERRADRTHGERNNVHGSALVGTASDIIELCVHFLGFAPVVGGTCVFFFLGADEGSVFYTSNVVGFGSVIVATGELFFVELDHFACCASFSAKSFELFFATVDNNYVIGSEKSFHVFNPIENGGVFCEFVHGQQFLSTNL